MKHTKLLAILLGGLMGATVFAGCANRVTKPQIYGDPVYIGALDRGFGVDWLEAVADAYYEETGIDVVITGDPEIGKTLETSMGTTASKNDLYFTLASPAYRNKWARENWSEPLDDVLSDDKYGVPANERLRDDTLKTLGMHDGKVYELPYIYSVWGFVYNMDYLNKIESYGTYKKGEIPQTMGELMDLFTATNNAKIVNPRTKNTVKPMASGLRVDYMNQLFFSLWYQQDPENFNAYWNQNDKSGYKSEFFDTPAVLKSFEAIFDLIGAKSNTESNLTGITQDHLESQKSFINGDCVVVMSASWFESEMSQNLQTANLNYRFAAYPKMEGVEKSAVSMNLPGEFFLIPSDDGNNIEGAKDFLAFLLSEEGIAVASKELNQVMAYTTEKPIELNEFGKDIESMIEASDCFYKFSTTDIYSTGALNLFMLETSPFYSMAKYEITSKDEIPVKIVQEEIKKHRLGWEDYMDKI